MDITELSSPDFQMVCLQNNKRLLLSQEASMRIFIMLGSNLLSAAFKRLLIERCPNYEIYKLFPMDDLSTYHRSGVIIADYFSFEKLEKNGISGFKIIILDEGLEKEAAASLFATGKITGIIKPHSDLDTFIQAVEVVNRGDLWFDRSNFKVLVDSITKPGTLNSPVFSERERSVVNLLRSGQKNKEIASSLFISEQTVKSHLNRIFRKMGVTGRTELIRKLMMIGPGFD